MKMIVTEKQLKSVKGEIEEVTNSSMTKAERIYKMVKNTPFSSPEKMISRIARIIED